MQYDQIIVYHEDLTDEDIVKIKKIESKIRFIQYTLDDFCKEFEMKYDVITKYNFIKHYRSILFAKFKFLLHLDEFDMVIFFDLDMLITGNLSELFKYDFNIAWMNDYQSITFKLKRANFGDDQIKTLGMNDLYNKIMTPNGGFFIAKNNFDYKLAYATYQKYVKKYLLIHPINFDEISIGYVVYMCKLKVYNVEHKIYDTYPASVTSGTKLIHFLGSFKPWNNEIIQHLYHTWIVNYLKCMAISGISSDHVVIYHNINHFFLKIFYTSIWTYIFNELSFTYPKTLDLQHDFTQDKLVFTYNKFIIYYIQTHWLFSRLISVKILISITNINFKEKLQYSLNNIIKNYSEIKLKQEKTKIILEISNIHRDHIHYSFNWFYNMTEDVRKISDFYLQNILHSVDTNTLPDSGTLKTYHNTIVCFDPNTSTLCQAKSGTDKLLPISAVCYEKKIALGVQTANFYSWLKTISPKNKVTLTTSQNFFDYVVNDDQTISIQIFDRFLSAEQNSTFSFKNWNKEWEHFTII